MRHGERALISVAEPQYASSHGVGRLLLEDAVAEPSHEYSALKELWAHTKSVVAKL